MSGTSEHRDTYSCGEHKFQNCSQYFTKGFTQSILVYPKWCFRVVHVQGKAVTKGIQASIDGKQRESNLVFFIPKHCSRKRQNLQICCFLCIYYLLFSLCFQWTRSLVNPAGASVGFLAHSHCTKNTYTVVFEDLIQTVLKMMGSS